MSFPHETRTTVWKPPFFWPIGKRGNKITKWPLNWFSNVFCTDSNLLWQGNVWRNVGHAGGRGWGRGKTSPRRGSTCMRMGLSAPSPGDDLRLKLAIRLRSQTVRSDSFWEIGCDFSAITIWLRLRCILRWKMGKFASCCGNSLAISSAIQKSR